MLCEPAKDHTGFQIQELIISVQAWSIRTFLKWVILQSVDSSSPVEVMASTSIAFFQELTSSLTHALNFLLVYSLFKLSCRNIKKVDL